MLRRVRKRSIAGFAMSVTTIKKYGNRRLYDTEESRYITLEELTDLVKRGKDVHIVDAKTGEDLTQATLVQVVLETKAARLLPVGLLSRLIRMQDDSLGEFFSKYVTTALEMYLAAKQGAQAMSPYVPFSTLPFTAGNALARAMGGLPFWGNEGGFAQGPQQGYAPPQQPPQPMAPPPAEVSDVAALRHELDELKRAIMARPAAPAATTKAAANGAKRRKKPAETRSR